MALYYKTKTIMLENIFSLLTLIGVLSFMSFGICVANSIEARENKLLANILTALTAIGLLLIVIGMFGLFIISL